MNWSKSYEELVHRNIGILTPEQQETLRTSRVCVAGLGGLGGVVLEVLARSGVGSFSLVDRDLFEESNLNRQIFSFRDTLGELKTTVAEEFIDNINPELDVSTYRHVGSDNAYHIVDDCDVVVMCLDGLDGILYIAREAEKQDIPLVEGWAMPYGNVGVLDKNTPTLEETYDMPTIGRQLNEFSDDEFVQMRQSMLAKTASNVDGLVETYPSIGKFTPEGVFSSFAPMVWLTAIFMAMETIKILLNLGTLAYDPAIYDPFKHNVVEWKK